MIIKDWKKEEDARDKNAAAGAEAEKQLAHYLKRKYADQKDVLVFNNLRYETEQGDDAAQIDHLIFHRHGFIIIESKSVTRKVKINERGEWQRLWNGYYEGMASPILQAQRQADFLKGILNHNKGALRKKVFLLNRTYNFNVCPFDILVAISDKGIIDGIVPENVFKADQIPDEVEKVILRHKTADLRLSLKDGNDKFPDDEMERIAQFLLETNRPRSVGDRFKKTDPVAKEKVASVRLDGVEVAPIASPSSMTENITRHEGETVASEEQKPTLCPTCNTNQVHILYGPHGYYFRCQSCGKSFSIDFICPKCGKKSKIRKDKEGFFRECGGCNHQNIYHTNR